jgi:integrase/recombinase XerD
MAPRFSVDRYRHLASAVHARQWLIMREQIGLSPNTLDAYARAIDSYYFFLESHEHTCETSNQRDVASWISELRARGLANATLIQRVTALRLFFEYLVEEGLRPWQSSVPRGGT